MTALIGAILAMAQAKTQDAASVLPAPTSETIRERRAERLAADKAALAAEIATIDAFGRVDEFRDALRELEKNCGEVEPGKERWAQISEGWLPMMAVDHWLLWHQPAEGRSLPLAIDFEIPNHPLPALVDLSEQLHAHDVEFILAIFPSRVQLYPELVLPGLKPEDLVHDKFRGMVGATSRFALALNERGVETVHLASDFIEERREVQPDGTNGDLYLYRNKHWTPRAAEIAARVVAERIKAMPWFAPGPIKEGQDFTITRRVMPFMSTAGGQSPDKTPEQLAVNQLRQIGKALNPAEARRSPIVVLGDSFAKFYAEVGATSSFIDHLRRHTGWPIDLVAPLGGAELQCRVALAQRGDKLRGKKVVIWLVQEDNLRPTPAYRCVDMYGE